MAAALIILLVFVGFFFLLFLWGVGVFNGLVKLKNLMQEAWSGVDVQLKKRYDLIPNLVETVKGYATHEKETFENVTKARNLARDADTPAKTIEAEKALRQSMISLFAVAEAYPELKANENFLNLQAELSDIEGDIEKSRRYYNGTVRDMNTKVESFPSNVIANTFGFKKGAFFEIEEAAQKEAPKVSF